MTDSIKLAEEYEKAGKFEEAQEQLRTIGKLKPEMPGLKEKIDKLNEAVFETNDFDVDLDVADSWKRQVQVSKGKPVRVEATGNYKLMLSGPVDANGVPTKDLLRDMASGVLRSLDGRRRANLGFRFRCRWCRWWKNDRSRQRQSR